MQSNVPATAIGIELEASRGASAILDEGGMPFEVKVNKNAQRG